MSEAVRDNSGAKLGCRIALALEEQFIAQGWPVGNFAGSEEALSHRFGVSRRIVREATRVLTMRGIVRLKRGVTLGLEITPPDIDLIVDIMRGYAFLNDVTEAHRTEALTFLERVDARVSGVEEVRSALDFLLQFLREDLTPGAPPLGVGRDRLRKARAGQIVFNIIQEFFFREFEPGRRIGSEEDLSLQFNADRSITRQAIRLLESSGLVTSMPGRGNGIIIQRPPSGPVCRLICCLFASRQLSVAGTFELFHAMSVEAVSLAATKANAEDVQRLQRELHMSRTPEKFSDLFSTEDAQFEAIRNPLIDLFIRSIRGYVALTINESGKKIPQDVAECFANETRRVYDAIIRHAPEAAAQAHDAKFCAMRDLERSHNPTLADMLYLHGARTAAHATHQDAPMQAAPA
ncbi:GntR family transcriptional regulator [Paraburkholderia sp. J67]|uniref:GntR family transcriptional regulator n=1 Tax=Paraburkholderia sp. J67 TaxID=2805435 RepID=UPI002ABDC094|nr:GntR family transcriptional regulator [Paraburkholderia sp. J67]